MVLAAILDGQRDPKDDSPIFLVRGGVAMELRTGGSARATRDFDSALRANIDDLATHLDPALRSGFGDFSAVRTQIEPVRDTGALRCEIKIAYRHKPVVTVPFEIASTEAGMAGDIDHVPALSLTHLGLDGPATVACVAVRWQIAQKLHACTERPADRENDRFRDLIDLQILGNLVADDSWQDLRSACVAVSNTGLAMSGHPFLQLPALGPTGTGPSLPKQDSS
jgi:Nucleotidyl transferase AbiEii toxin, Type IV TA system